MSAPIYSREDYTSALMSLLPRGRAWPKEPDSDMYQSLSFIGQTFVRQNERAATLISDAFPAGTTELLPEWEAMLGLPDPCAGPAPTIQARRSQVVARFANDGGQSIGFLESFALNLGYVISITNHAPFRCGQSRCGDHLGNEDWFFAFTVESALHQVTPFRAGSSAAGEPLASWENSSLECEIASVAPAHTVPIFSYT